MISIKKKSIGSILLLVLIILNSISFINMNLFLKYEKVSFYINLLIIILLFISEKKIYKNEQQQLIFIIMLGCFGLFTLLVTGGGIGSVVTPIYSILLIIVMSRFSFSKNMIKLLFVILIGVNLILVYNSPGYYKKAMYDKSNYLNSNTVAMVIMYTFIYCKILMQNLKLKYHKIVITLLFAFSIWGILNCEARGSLFTLVSFIVLDIFIPKSFWKSKVRTMPIIIIIIGIGVMVPFIMVNLYEAGVNFTLHFTSKSLYTGREVIWSNFYSLMDNNIISWMLGLGSKVKLWDIGDVSLHNNYLAVISNFGIIGFIIYYSYILKIVSSLYRKNHLTNYQISLLIGFICVLLNGYIEITTLWSTMFYFNFMFLGIALNEVYINKKCIES